MARRPPAAAVVLAILALANLLSYASRNAPFAVYDDLRAQFGVDDRDLGWLGTAFMLPHALATLPVGWLADRADRRRVLAAGILLWSAAGVLGAVLDSYTAVLCTRVLVGLGTAAVVPVANAILGERYAGGHKALAMAVFNLGLFFGGAAGFGVGAGLGFPASWIAIAAPGFLLAVVVVTVIDAKAAPVPTAQLRAAASLGDHLRHLLADTRAVLAVPTLRRLATATTVMAFAAGGLQAWLLDFLQRDKGMSKEAATSLFTGCLVAGLFGVLAGGRVADRLRRRWAWGRPGAIALGMALTVPCGIGAILLPAGPALTASAVATMFFITWYHGPMAASVDDVAPAGREASAQAVVLFATHLIGTAPSSRIIGEINERWGGRPAMLTAAAAVAVAALLMTRAFATMGPDAAAAGRARAAFAIT
ncbi:MAG: MFS transporter [Myxococcales bacterium]|nr:MFS transporter [Myxococcales bacterium]MBK7196557.1 MFS transporter [Myxococcales bacterium]